MYVRVLVIIQTMAGGRWHNANAEKNRNVDSLKYPNSLEREPWSSG